MVPNDAISLFSRLKAAKRLPSPPGIAVQVLELCRRDDVDIQEIADTIMCDPALSGRLLRFANSPMSGVGREVTSIRDALLLLGLRQVKLIALGFSLTISAGDLTCPGFDLRGFWAESFVTGVIARRIAGDWFEADRQEAFTAGLLAGIGRLALAHAVPEEYGRVIETARREGVPLTEAERQLLRLGHAEFGAKLLQEWGLPEPLVRAVGLQDTPPQNGGVDSSMGRVLYASTRLAPLFVSQEQPSAEAGAAARDVIENMLHLEATTWKTVADELLREYVQVAQVFEVRLESQDSVVGLYAEAHEEAARVGMVALIERSDPLKANAELLRRATTDLLTGVANRVKFDDRLTEALKGLRRGHGDFAVLMLDIDHLTELNGTHGHQVGDLVLKRVATAVQNSLRDVDLLTRYGGEEFVVLAPHTDRRGACIVAARIRKCVEDLRIDAHGELVRVTISLGLAVTTDYRDQPTAGMIIADAEKQLNLSKEAGRNTWSYQGRSASQLAVPTRVG